VIWSLAGCLDDQVGRHHQESEFVAFQSDFADYAGWEDWQVADDPVGPSHLTGPRWVFVNGLPDPGATEWPTGTVIVKEARNGAPEDWDIFAMAKRGGGFNTDGAHGWEWFELSLDGDAVVIDWRGAVPPALAGYDCVSTDPSAPVGDCNACHSGSWQNDYVQDSVLRLGDLP